MIWKAIEQFWQTVFAQIYEICFFLFQHEVKYSLLCLKIYTRLYRNKIWANKSFLNTHSHELKYSIRVKKKKRWRTIKSLCFSPFSLSLSFSPWEPEFVPKSCLIFHLFPRCTPLYLSPSHFQESTFTHLFPISQPKKEIYRPINVNR